MTFLRDLVAQWRTPNPYLKDSHAALLITSIRKDCADALEPFIAKQEADVELLGRMMHALKNAPHTEYREKLILEARARLKEEG